MFNCIILGSGRSGTSMVAGTLAKAGYYMGKGLIPPREANPKGFFETSFINRSINEAIMAPKVQGLKSGQYWLAALPITTEFTVPPAVTTLIKKAVSIEPYCYKDPRFSYTLSAWMPYLKNTKFVCVFRHPAETATSYIKECNTAKYLHGFGMTREKAYNIYEAIYSSILKKHICQGQWLFIEYTQMLQTSGITKLGNFLEAKVDGNFPEATLQRSNAVGKIPNSTIAIYRKLKKLSGQ